MDCGALWAMGFGEVSVICLGSGGAAFRWGVVKWHGCGEPVISGQLIWAGHWIKLVRVLWVRRKVLETQTGSKGVAGNSVLSEH